MYLRSKATHLAKLNANASAIVERYRAWAAPGLIRLTPDTMIPVLSYCQYQNVALERILQL